MAQKINHIITGSISGNNGELSGETVGENTYLNFNGKRLAYSEALNTHIEEDAQRWQTMNDLIIKGLADVKQYCQELYEGTTPTYDYSQPTVVIGSNGLITVADGNEWTATGNGAIICSVGGLLGTSIIVKINDIDVWTSPISVLGLPVGGDENPSVEIRINSGDVVSTSGLLGVGQSLNITFYPNKL